MLLASAKIVHPEGPYSPASTTASPSVSFHAKPLTSEPPGRLPKFLPDAVCPTVAVTVWTQPAGEVASQPVAA